MCSAVSCRFAKEEQLGDTVAAQVFEPVVAAKKKVVLRDSAATIAHDSVDIFYVGEGSTRHELQLVSYPSRRDTIMRSKARHIRVEGKADFGSVVRIKLWTSQRGDTLVKEVKVIPIENKTPTEL